MHEGDIKKIVVVISSWGTMVETVCCFYFSFTLNSSLPTVLFETTNMFMP
jgi:hypothetical protein